MTEEKKGYVTPLVKRQLPNEVLLSEVERMLAAGRDVVLVPKGRSMLPFIRGEVDKVLLQRVPQSQLKVGDIALACVGERYVMHRIIALDGDQVTLMGDGNLKATEHCVIDDIKAKATHVVSANEKSHDLYTPRRQWAAKVWYSLRPLRRYLLAIYRRL